MMVKAHGQVLMRRMVVALLLMGPWPAAAGAEVLGEDALRKLATDNTITGRYTFGGWFSEYHAPDGRVLGNNGWQENQDACWTTKNDAICYSYGGADSRQTYCFTIERSGDSLLLRNLSNGLLNAVGKVEPFNPRNHSDNGHSWNCDDRVSRLAPVLLLVQARHVQVMRLGWSVLNLIGVHRS